MGLYKVINIFKKIPPSTKSIPGIPRAVWRRPLYFVAFGFGSGAMPFAPGTFGTLMAIPFYLLLQDLPFYLYVTFVIFFAMASVYLCDKISRDTGTEDHPGMCIDEFVGFFVTMMHADTGSGWIILGFVLFRIFDIWKPWPIRVIDKKIHGGLGMVLDDMVAGLFGCIVMQCLMFLIKISIV